MNRIVIIGLFLCIFFVKNLYSKPDTIKYTNLTSEDFFIELQKNTNKVIIDARIYLNYRKDRLFGAISAERKKILDAIADTLDFETPLFVYCECNFRSTSVCEILIEKGFENVFHLEEGLIGWRAAGYPLDKRKLKK